VKETVAVLPSFYLQATCQIYSDRLTHLKDPSFYLNGHLGTRTMRDFVKTVARSLPIVRDLVDQPDTVLTRHDRAPTVHAAVARNGPEYWVRAEHGRKATHDDVFYCFRLLLGRNPKPEEWPGHSSRVGEDLENVVSSYVTSREFAERGLLNKTYCDAVELVRFPKFSLFVSNDDLAVGHHVLGGSYEPAIAAVLERYAKPGMSVVDIGANIGCFTMRLASLVGPSGLVVAVEPNPENVKLLEASRRANGFHQVLVLQAAAGRQTGLLTLNVSYSNGMTGELPDNFDAIFASHPVPGFPLDVILPKDRHFNLVKIDIEGAELNALIGLSETIDRSRPVIVSEFSPGMLPGISHCSGPEFLRFMIAKGYAIGVVEKDGSENGFGTNIDGVMGAYSRSGVDHIDIIATPA
jgi:FkbM family methyltransferase